MNDIKVNDYVRLKPVPPEKLKYWIFNGDDLNEKRRREKRRVIKVNHIKKEVTIAAESELSLPQTWPMDAIEKVEEE